MEYDEEREQAMQSAYSLQNAEQINELIGTVSYESNKIKLYVPKTKTKSVYVALKDVHGKVMLNYNGDVLHEKTEVPVFDSWETKEVELPAPELFRRDLIYAVLDEHDRKRLDYIHRLYSRLIVAMIKDGHDFSKIVWFLSQRASTIIETSRAKDGKTLDMSKTTITQGQTTSRFIEQRIEEQMKKSWNPMKKFFGNNQNQEGLK